MSARAVVDQRVHRDDVVEAAERRVEHVADAEVDRARRRDRAAARSRARSTSVGERSIATTSRAAPRGLDRERAGAAAGVEHARAAQVVRQPAKQRRAHRVAAGAHGGADAADRRVRGQPRPGLDRGAVEVGLAARRGASM